MRRFIQSLTLLLLFFTSLLTLVVRARPVDDSGLRQLLNPPDCPAPCFLGIRPGVTTMTEAFAHLSQHPWVGTLEHSDNNITWTWNGQQPSIFDHTSRGSLTSLKTDIFGYPLGTVTGINLTSRLAYGQLYLTMGGGRNNEYYAVRSNAVNRRLFTYYEANRMAVGAQVQCPINQRLYWNTPVFISYGLITFDLFGVACRRRF